jgi:protein-S-isoprenylcysteine O-methyltransferase Ste14
MDEELLFRYLFIAIYAAFFGVRIRYRIESTRREPEKRHQTYGVATKVLIVAILGYIASIILYMLSSPWTTWSQIALPTWLRWLGVIGATSSILLVAWIHRELGRQYSAELAIQKEHALVTTGPYARTRHPMYTTLNLFSLSMALMSRRTIPVDRQSGGGDAARNIRRRLPRIHEENGAILPPNKTEA